MGGERTDHSVANIQNLAYICENGGTGFILHRDSVFLAIKNSTVTFKETCEGYISVFSLRDESKGVTEKNLKYIIDDYTLLSSKPMGVSNEFTGQKASVGVKDGVLLVIFRGRLDDCETS